MTAPQGLAVAGHRPTAGFLAPLLAYIVMAILVASAFVTSAVTSEVPAGAKAKHGTTTDRATVIAAKPAGTTVAPAGSTGFSPQARLGFTEGDQWEPAIAADRSGHVYVLYPQYGGVPGCVPCADPTMILTTSSDEGVTWSPPRVVYPAGQTGGEWDAQIAVDPVDGRTVYAAWLQEGKSVVAVARSSDFGASWDVVVANRNDKGTDKPILAVRGQDVYVAYNHATQMFVSASHDGGRTFTETKANANGKLGWALAGGGTVAPDGSAHFSWAGYERNGGATGAVNLFVSSSDDGGTTWHTSLLDVSGSPPDCSAYRCGWAYLGAQATLAAGADGTLYALWNAGAAAGGAERIYFARSIDAGRSWSREQDVSLAPAGVAHAFPAVVAGAAGDVRIAWMDARAQGGTLWNTYLRTSRDGGRTWSGEADLSTPVSGYSYIFPDGFRYPFGDYFELDIDGRGRTHAVWGEGFDYGSPGSIWYARGR